VKAFLFFILMTTGITGVPESIHEEFSGQWNLFTISYKESAMPFLPSKHDDQQRFIKYTNFVYSINNSVMSNLGKYYFSPRGYPVPTYYPPLLPDEEGRPFGLPEAIMQRQHTGCGIMIRGSRYFFECSDYKAIMKKWKNKTKIKLYFQGNKILLVDFGLRYVDKSFLNIME
jgi:hypothetical protein